MQVKLSAKMLTAVASVALLASCSGGSSSSDDKYLCVQTEDSRLWSILDVSSAKIEKADEFQNPITKIVNGAFFVANSENKYDIFTLENTTTPLNKDSYDATTGFNKNGYAIVVTMNHPAEVVDVKGNVVATIPTNIQPVGVLADNNLAPIVNAKNNYGYMNEKGEVVIQPRYIAYKGFSDGVAIVTKQEENNKLYYAVIDGTGNEVFSFNSGQYSNVSDFKDGYAFAVQSDQVVLLNKQGEKVTKVNDGSDISRLSIHGDKFTYTDGKFYGVKDINGDIVVRAKYLALEFLADGNLMATNQNQKLGVITVEDNEVMPFEYTELRYIMPDRYINKMGNSYVLIDSKGKEVCKVAFDKVENMGGSETQDVIRAFVGKVQEAIERVAKIVQQAGNSDNIEIDFTSLSNAVSGASAPSGMSLPGRFLCNPDHPDPGYYEENGEWYEAEKKYRDINGNPSPNPFGVPMGDPNNTDSYSFLVLEPVQNDPANNRMYTALEPEYLAALRNVIYALNGYRFQDDRLTAFFSQFMWYVPHYDNVEGMLSEVEAKNVQKLKALEDKARNMY